LKLRAALTEDFLHSSRELGGMNLKAMLRNAALAGVALYWTGNGVGEAAQTATNVELVAAGLEEHVGFPDDRVSVKVYQGDAAAVLHKLDFSWRNPIKQLNLARAGTYRLSFESHEPDEEGATSCSATIELKVLPKQSYRVAFTVLKRLCLLNTGRIGEGGVFEQIANVDGEVRRLPAQK
jgi:hypothetical protein